MRFTDRPENKQVPPGAYCGDSLCNLDCSGDMTIDSLKVNNVRAKGTLRVIIRKSAQISNIEAGEDIVYVIMPGVKLTATNQEVGGKFKNNSPGIISMNVSTDTSGPLKTVVYERSEENEDRIDTSV